MNLKLVKVKLGTRRTVEELMKNGYRYTAARRETTKQMRVYMAPHGETVIENLFVGRHNRPHEALRKLVDQAISRAGLKMKHVTRIRWSQYAGCTCPCSPGFIVDAHEYVGMTLFADYIDADQKPVLPGVRKRSQKATKK